jgi:hypothetical protein
MKKDISKNYITIQGWMVQDLQLKGNELLSYALIFGFCQDKDTEFTGSINYLCNWLNCSKPTVLKAINGLIKKGLIIKKQELKNNVKFNHFTIDFSAISQNFTSSKETLLVVKNRNKGSKETLLGGSKETLPNNTNIYKDNNTDTRVSKYPTFDEFRDYAITTASEKLGIKVNETKLKSKYLSWSENNWINGNGKKIKNWKTTLINSLPYLKLDQNDTEVKSTTSQNGAKHRGFRYN